MGYNYKYLQCSKAAIRILGHIRQQLDLTYGLSKLLQPFKQGGSIYLTIISIYRLYDKKVHNCVDSFESRNYIGGEKKAINLNH